MSPTSELLDAAKAYADALDARNALGEGNKGWTALAQAASSARIKLERAALDYGRAHSKRVRAIDESAAFEMSVRP